MKIAYVSSECPPDTGPGGIGTYVMNAARFMQERGHHVEIFASSRERAGSFEQEGILVHRIREVRQERFREAIVAPFSQRHRERPFDVLESPEYFYEGSEIVAAFPALPFVVRLHTPLRLIMELESMGRDPEPSSDSRNFWPQLRGMGRAILQGRTPPAWKWSGWKDAYALEHDAAERDFAARADLVASPSRSLLEIMKDRWRLDPTRLSHVPYPYHAPEVLLEIPIETETNVISYFGRLEARKGMRALAAALPTILEELPAATFRFVGRDSVPGPQSTPSYSAYLRQAAGKAAHRLEFTGPLPLSATYGQFTQTDLCVFPSIWENFPNVCLEAMAAGRGIVASQAGGMAEMIRHEIDGLVIDPSDAGKLAAATIQLASNASQRRQFGRSARQRLLDEYAGEKASSALEASYRQAIEHRKQVAAQ